MVLIVCISSFLFLDNERLHFILSSQPFGVRHDLFYFGRNEPVLNQFVVRLDEAR